MVCAYVCARAWVHGATRARMWCGASRARMYVCMYVCVCVCMHGVRACVCMVCGVTRARMWCCVTRARMYACMYACIYVYVCAFVCMVCACMHAVWRDARAYMVWCDTKSESVPSCNQVPDEC